MIKKITYLFILALILFLKGNFADAASLSLSPLSGGYEIEEQFNVEILLDTEEIDTHGTGIRFLNYNSSLLEVQDADFGEEGIQIAKGELYKRTQVNSINPAEGKIEFIQLTAGGDEVYNGSGVLATVTFKVLSAGTANLNFNFTFGSTTDCNVASGGEDVLTSVAGGSYTLSSLSDTVPPANIADLSAGSSSQTSITLAWTAPGNDGSTGTASSYDIRYSTSNITEANWSSATQVTGEPTPSVAGTLESYTAVGFSSSTVYYFAVRTSDEVPNNSGLSNIASVTTAAAGGGGGGGGGGTSDTTPPGKVTDFTVAAGDQEIILTWKNPADSDFVRTKILRKETDYPASSGDGKMVYDGDKETYTDIGLTNNITYYYAAFAYDERLNYSGSATANATPVGGGSSPAYPDGTLLKIPESFKIYVMIDQKKKWIPTPEVFETLGYQWGSIAVIDKTELNNIPNYEDNLIRAIGNYKVYLVVNGINRHIPNPEIFLNYGFAWEDVVDVPQSTIDKYRRAYLVRESRQGTIYYLRNDGVKKWIRNPEIFASYNNKWEDIQVISKPEMDSYPESNLIQLSGDDRIYLLEGNIKRWIASAQTFNARGLDWNHIIEVNEMEFGWYEAGGEVK